MGSKNKQTNWPQEFVMGAKELLLKNVNNPKFINFSEFKFPVENPIELKVIELGVEITLSNYLYPAAIGK